MGSPFLNIGQITDVLHSVGIYSVCHIIYIRLNIPSIKLGPPSFRSSAQIRSSPAALLFLSYLITISISALFGITSSFLRLVFVDSHSSSSCFRLCSLFRSWSKYFQNSSALSLLFDTSTTSLFKTNCVVG